MRIIAGRFKGRRLTPPTWDGLRPTSDKLRETLFNILASRIEDARVLDGYTGTGAIGIEALSRGAADVVFVEKDRRAVALIERNLAACAVTEGYTIHGGDVATVLSRLDASTLFDVIVLDPPYDLPGVTAALDVAAAHLAVDAMLILERATRQAPVTPSSLHRVRDVRSGDSSLTFFARR